jgi:hypothetical protein
MAKSAIWVQLWPIGSPKARTLEEAKVAGMRYT